MKLDTIRRDYTQAGLSRDEMLADPIAQFERWLDQAIAADLNADPTAMSVATVDATGQPHQRTVLLKQLDERGFVFYTNLQSQKARDIASNAQVCLHFMWLPVERQVVISGQATPLTATEAQTYFQSRPRQSQLAAWASQQSQPIASRTALEQQFSQMQERFAAGDIPLPSFWGGYRVTPTRLEFWQGRGARLHDRLVYISSAQGWEIIRLQP